MQVVFRWRTNGRTLFKLALYVCYVTKEIYAQTPEIRGTYAHIVTSRCRVTGTVKYP
jgi:hypothetical protein